MEGELNFPFLGKLERFEGVQRNMPFGFRVEITDLSLRSPRHDLGSCFRG